MAVVYGTMIDLAEDEVRAQYELLGVLAGLLEAWAGYTTGCTWESKLKDLDLEKRRRIKTIYNLLETSFVTQVLMYGYETCFKRMLLVLARL